MALSGTIWGAFSGVSTSNVRPVLEWSATQNISGNYSDVTISLVFLRYNTSWQSWNANGHNVTMVVDGNSLSANRTFDIRGKSREVVWTRTRRVNHNSNGAKSFGASVSGNTGVSLGSYNFSGTATLNTIPRASSITSFSNFSVRPDQINTFNISLSRASGSFTHDIALRIGSTTIQSWNNQGLPSSLSLNASASNALLNNMRNVTSATVTLRVQTKSGSTNIGSVVTRNATASVHSSVVPTINSTSVSESVTNIAQGLGVYVQNRSRLNLSMSVSAGYGARNDSFRITIDNHASNNSSFTTGVLSNSGTRTITFRFTNTRGQTVTTTRTITVYAYLTPTINLLDPVRADSSGAVSDEGSHAYIRYKATVSPLNNTNVRQYLLRYRPRGGTWTNVTISSTSYNLDGNILIPNFDPDYEYDVRLEVTDFFTTNGQTEILPSAFDLINFHPDGRGIAFGGVMQRSEGFDVFLDARFLGGVSFEEYPSKWLGSNTNLNDVTAPGMYHCTLNSTAETMTNLPIPGTAFSLLVERHAGRKQTFTRYHNSEPRTWIRNFYSGTWGNWWEVQFK